jgi:periplasmic protein CpxP/Spy
MMFSTKRLSRPSNLVVATLLVAAAGALSFSVEAAGPGMHGGMHAHADAHGGGPGMGMHGGMGGGDHGMRGGPRHMEHMLDGVNATAEQRAQIKTIMQTAMNDLKPTRDAGKALHAQMRAAWAQPTVDANVIEALRLQQQALHNTASKRMQQAKLDISRVLTPEQRKLMADRMAKRQAMAERHRAERSTLAPGSK